MVQLVNFPTYCASSEARTRSPTPPHLFLLPYSHSPVKAQFNCPLSWAELGLPGTLCLPLLELLPYYLEIIRSHVCVSSCALLQCMVGHLPSTEAGNSETQQAFIESLSFLSPLGLQTCCSLCLKYSSSFMVCRFLSA